MKINSALIIDDEVDICLLLKTFLKKKSANVSYSTNLKDGFLKFKELNPDLLILDHNLPDGHGIENIINFKKENSSLFIIVISAMSNLKNKALESGADFFMEKPLSFNKLNELIDNGN
ncbi:MAG: response regulator [Bacteroidota bacterium]